MIVVVVVDMVVVVKVLDVVVVVLTKHSSINLSACISYLPCWKRGVRRRKRRLWEVGGGGRGGWTTRVSVLV